MKSVYLNYTSNTNEFYVSEEDYRNVIRPSVMKLRVCSICQQYYDIDAMRPCVGLRICMDCFLRKHSHLRFLEVKSVDDDGEATYAFIDGEGNVYTSRENYSDSPSKDVSYTLRQHSFSLPERHKPFKATEETRLHTAYFTIYGDLQTASVLVADYNDYYDKHHTAFLLYKNGGYKELTKRGEGKVLIERATAMLEQTKLPNGYYKIDDHQVYRIGDGDIYKIISQMETAMYNISMQFAPPVQLEPIMSEETEVTTETVEQPNQAEQETPAVTEPSLEEEATTEEVAIQKRGRRGRLHTVSTEEQQKEATPEPTDEEQAVQPMTDETVAVDESSMQEAEAPFEVPTNE